VLFAVVAIGVAAAHWPALSAEAQCFDDGQYLTDNPLIQNPSWNSAWRFLTEVFEPSTVGGYYEPLPTLRPFHRTSLLLHVLNSLLVSLLVLLLFRNPWVAALAGLLFGVHPLTVEPIPWVGQRKTLLAAFFSLCCLCLYVLYASRARDAKRGKRSGWPYLGSLAAYALALLSKPTSLSVVALVFVLDFWPLRRLGRKTLVEKIPFFVLAGLSAIVASISQKRTSTFVILDTYSRVKTALVLCHNHIFYLAKMLWPADLSLFYPYPEPLSLKNPVVLAGVVGTALLIPALLASLRWTRAWLAGWAFFFLATLPTLGVVGATETVAADRYAYLPLVGLVLLVAWLLARLWTARAGTLRPWLLAVALLMIAGEGVTTRAQPLLSLRVLAGDRGVSAQQPRDPARQAGRRRRRGGALEGGARGQARQREHPPQPRDRTGRSGPAGRGHSSLQAGPAARSWKRHHARVPRAAARAGRAQPGGQGAPGAGPASAAGPPDGARGAGTPGRRRACEGQPVRPPASARGRAYASR
jgi:hypothetical protein